MIGYKVYSINEVCIARHTLKTAKNTQLFWMLTPEVALFLEFCGEDTEWADNNILDLSKPGFHFRLNGNKSKTAWGDGSETPSSAQHPLKTG